MCEIEVKRLGGKFILRADTYGTGKYFISQWANDLNDYEDCNQAMFVNVGQIVNFSIGPGGTCFLRTYSVESNYLNTWWNSSHGSENCAEAESFTVTTG